MSDFCLDLSIYLVFFWFKECKQSNGVYSEKNLLKEFLMKNLIRGN